jgi:hypothetical protein
MSLGLVEDEESIGFEVCKFFALLAICCVFGELL